MKRLFSATETVSVKNRSELETLVRALSTTMGLNGTYVWRDVHRKTEAGRFILGLLGVSPDKLFPRHRPRNLSRLYAIASAVKWQMDEGRSRPEAIKHAAKNLEMSEAAVRMSLRRNPHALAEFWFEDLREQDDQPPSSGPIFPMSG